MAEIFNKNGFRLNVSRENAEKLGLKQDAEYEINALNNTTFALVERRESLRETDEKIINKLKEKKLSERVEGKFEEFLDSEELARFKELIGQGIVIPFKLSEKYKKAVYKLSGEVKEAGHKFFENELEHSTEKPLKKSVKQREVKEIPSERSESEPETLQNVSVPAFDEMHLAKHDFAVIKDANVARALSERLRNEIQKREILGLRGFGGEYFIIKRNLYEQYASKVLGVIKQGKSVSLAQIAGKLQISNELAKTVCEFLKEEGEIAERRKDIYEYIY